MMRKALMALILMGIMGGQALSSGVLSAHAQDGRSQGNGSPVLERLRARILDGQVFKASFRSEYIDSFTQDTTLVEGTLWLGSEGYRVETDQQTLVVAGRESRVWDPARNRLIVSDYRPEDDDFAPSVVLGGVEDGMRASESPLGRGVAIDLVSDDPFATLSRIRLEVERGDLPVRAVSTDQADNRTVTRLIGSVWLMRGAGGRGGAPQGLFTLVPPAGADVVDLRESGAHVPDSTPEGVFTLDAASR